MRILLIHNKYKQAGGEDSVVDSERELLERHGHQVRLYYFDNKDINSFSKKIRLTYQFIYNIRSEKIIKDLITDFKPDVMHVHNLFYLASPSVFAAAKNMNIPVVVTLHNYRLICAGALLMRDSKPCELCINKTFPLNGIKYKCHSNSRVATANLLFMTGIHKVIGTWNNNVSIYIALTEFARNKFIYSSLNLQPTRIVVKPNSVDNTEPVALQEREDYFLFIGRLSKEKGVEVLLKAFENKSIKIKIIGDGPLRETVERISAYSTNIEYLGYKDKSYILSKLKKSLALIVPSICYEGLPTAILEAFSTGTPVIVSDIDNLNSIVANNYNGLHFRTNDSKSLYSIVEKISINSCLYRNLYSNSRQTYINKYTPEMNYVSLVEIYRKAKEAMTQS